MNFRAATLADIEFVCRLDALARPDEPTDPDTLRYEWESTNPGHQVQRSIALEEGEPVGYAFWSHPDWATVGERHANGYLNASPERAALLPALVEAVETMAREGGVALLTADCREDETAQIAAFESRAFRLDHLAKVWELDLVAQRDSLLEAAAASRAAMASQAIRVLPLSEVPGGDLHRRLYELWNESRKDVPRSHETMPVSFEFWEQWMTGPDHRDDRCMVALDGDRMVALSNLRYPPRIGNVWTGYTGSLASHRGRGIAKAVKLEILAQAIELGVLRVRTDNDERNAPMLHINEELGYHRVPGWLSYDKDL